MKRDPIELALLVLVWASAAVMAAIAVGLLLGLACSLVEVLA